MAARGRPCKPEVAGRTGRGGGRWRGTTPQALPAPAMRRPGDVQVADGCGHCLLAVNRVAARESPREGGVVTSSAHYVSAIGGVRVNLCKPLPHDRQLHHHLHAKHLVPTASHLLRPRVRREPDSRRVWRNRRGAPRPLCLPFPTPAPRPLPIVSLVKKCRRDFRFSPRSFVGPGPSVWSPPDTSPALRSATRGVLPTTRPPSLPGELPSSQLTSPSGKHTKKKENKRHGNICKHEQDGGRGSRCNGKGTRVGSLAAHPTPLCQHPPSSPPSRRCRRCRHHSPLQLRGHIPVGL